jgi:dipeptidyl aminopeptidase/acylaminoacyl peptidase
MPEQYAKASPIAYVRKDSPPVLLFQGDKDDEVPLEQAMLLDAKMTQAGASHMLIVKKGAGHQSFHTEKAVWDFFDRNLKVSWWKHVLGWLGL